MNSPRLLNLCSSAFLLRKLFHPDGNRHPAMLLYTNPQSESERQLPIRSGFSLFEVVISLGIFGLAIAAIYQLVSLGVRASLQSQLKTEALIRCESKMGELLSGVTPFTAVDHQPFEEEFSAKWAWSLEVLPAPVEQLYLLHVSVHHLGESTQEQVTVTLTRFARDPDELKQIEISKLVGAAE